jgi:uncharacterized protein YndB with AHSA1/START domain
MTEPGRIELTQHIPHPPARVWAALTQPELHAKWWAQGDVRAEVGHRFELDMGQWGKQACEVLAVEPQRLLSYTFAPGTLDTTITWKLEPDGDGTRLTLIHEGFDLDSPLAKSAYEGMRNGWPGLMGRIAEVALVA